MAKFLLVDDNADLIEVQSAYLRNHGHQVVTARNGRDALAALERGDFDVIVTDVIMPDMDGFETIMTVRQRFPDLPIIAVSGGGRIGATDYLSMARSMGAKSALSKPVSPAMLLSETKRILSPQDPPFES